MKDTPFNWRQEQQEALWAVLARKDKENREYACAFTSSLKRAEVYAITEKKLSRSYLGCKTMQNLFLWYKFTIVTDYSAWTWLMNKNDPTGKSFIEGLSL